MRVKSPDKRKLHGAETKERIYKIAKRMCSEKEYDEVMIEDITDEAGITKGAFYTHFESKDALIALIIADNVSSADMDYNTYVEGLADDMTIRDKLLGLTERIADVMTTDIGYRNMRKVYQLMFAGTVNTTSLSGHERKLYALLCELTEEGIRRGEIRSDISIQSFARHYVAAFRGICIEWCIHPDDVNLKEQSKACFEIFMRGATLYETI